MTSALTQHQTRLSFTTPGRGLVAIGRPVADWVAAVSRGMGLLTMLLQHTSASLLIQENADPDVQGDLERFFARLVRDGDPIFHHTAEGPDDMPAHVRAALTQTQLSVPVSDGVLQLGTWQGLYLYEHRISAHTRRLFLHYVGD